LTGDKNGNLYGTTQTGGAGGAGTVFELERITNNRFKFHLLHAFCQGDCTDGAGPWGGLIIDQAGNLYGTTIGGGPKKAGTVYKLVRQGSHSKWRLVNLFAFNFSNGDEPMAPLSYLGAETGAPYDGVSPLYGTAYQGGKHKSGLIFKLTPRNKTYAQIVLHEFCSVDNCTDGNRPSHGVYVDGAGNVFGTTDAGGDADGGVVFELSPGGKVYRETVLYSFCQLTRCADGALPGQITIDASGNFIGTTYTGGAQNSGAVFNLIPNGKRSQETVLYSFCAQFNCADGGAPLGAISIDKSGNFFGIGSMGAAFNDGALFEISGGTESVLYSFCALPNCADGAAVNGGVVLDNAGNVFGHTLLGGANNGGTIFRFTP
jgi:uncharacterized repeat protein (TIGR03803 family)